MMESTDLTQEVSNAGAKLLPPAVVSVVSASGYTLQDWVFIATIGYLLIQATHLLWKWRREAKAKSAA